MVNFYQLQIFIEVVEQRSFSKAAIQLNLSQSAVSQQIRVLEEHYKVRLFVRYGQKIEPTEAAYTLAALARNLVEDARQLDERFSAGAGEMQGRLSIVHSRTAAGALYLLPGLMHHFHQKYPQVQFFLQGGSEEEAANKLLEHEVNFAVLSYTPRQKTLDYFLLQSDQLKLVLPPSHSWNNTKVALHELEGQPFVLRRTGSETRRRLETALRAAGLVLNDLKIVAEVDSAEGVALAVGAGLGLGFLVSSIADCFKELGRAELLISEQEKRAGVDLNRDVYLVRNLPDNEREPSPAQQRFWEDLRLFSSEKSL